jgi:hypothetical protein
LPRSGPHWYRRQKDTPEAPRARPVFAADMNIETHQAEQSAGVSTVFRSTVFLDRVLISDILQMRNDGVRVMNGAQDAFRP